MKKNLKEALKNNPITRTVIYFIKLLTSYIQYPFLRHSKDLSAYKNKHKGERCFVVATGPSLTMDDLTLLKGEVTFSMNSIIKSFDKTDWRPTYYVITDKVPYAACKDLIDEKDFEQIFFRTGLDQKNKSICHFSVNTVNVYHASMLDDYNGKIYPSKKPDRYFNDGPSVVFSIIQLADYMGFSEIYLLGQDCNFEGASHSDVAKLTYKVAPKVKDGLRILSAFDSYQQYYKNTDLRIFNATRGGKLESFQRVELKKITSNKENV